MPAKEYLVGNKKKWNGTGELIRKCDHAQNIADVAGQPSYMG